MSNQTEIMAKHIESLEAENNSLKADIEVLNDDCRIAKENEIQYHKAYMSELDENARLKEQLASAKILIDAVNEHLESYKHKLAVRTTPKAICDIIVELREENAQLKAQLPKWISVKDRLPDILEDVIIFLRTCFLLRYILWRG